jgi:hypothetical protein
MTPYRGAETVAVWVLISVLGLPKNEEAPSLHRYLDHTATVMSGRFDQHGDWLGV